MKKSKTFILLIFSSIIFGQGPSVAERYGDRIELLGIPFQDPLVLCQILIAIFISIAFIQSGIDKILDRKGNLEFFKVHFANTFLKNKIVIIANLDMFFHDSISKCKSFDFTNLFISLSSPKLIILSVCKLSTCGHDTSPFLSL